MWKQAIDQRSPMRNIENSIHKGLGSGHVGAITARPGIGKTACLMQIGINELIHERDVLHVAVNQTAGRVRDVYDELLHEMAHACGIDNEFDALRVAVERHRHLHGYTADSFDVSHLRDALVFLKTYADFAPKIILIDGVDSVTYAPSIVDELVSLAAERELAVWITLVADGADDKQALPRSLSDQAGKFTQILHLVPEGERIALQVLKNGEKASEELRVHLDTSTMLLAKDA